MVYKWCVNYNDFCLPSSQELISCKDVTISINPQDKLPTVTTERCENVHLYYYDPRALGSVYTVKCTNIFVHLQPPYPSEMPLEIPAPEASNDQFVSTYKPQGKKMATARVIRGTSISANVKINVFLKCLKLLYNVWERC